MKNLHFISALLILGCELSAQEKEINKGLSFGFQVGQYQKDFAFGINVTSPYFASGAIAVRLRANLAFNEHEMAGSGYITWSPYSNVSLGFAGSGGMASEKIRLYGEGGLVCILPSSQFSSQAYNFGGYGLFGFEFFMNPIASYFIEIGGIGTGAIADKLPKKPIYSNGLMINAGFRMTM